MGLLDKLSGFTSEPVEEVKPETNSTNQKSNTVGLLKRSMLLTTRNRLDFFEFVNKYHFPLCAIFTNTESNLLITDSYGFDSESILKSKSTMDFWKGSLSEYNKWNFFKASDSTITPFYQFFSFEMQDKIKGLYIYAFEDKNEISKILLVAYPNEIQKDFSQEIIQDFGILTPEVSEEKQQISIPENNSLYTYKLIIEEAVNDLLSNINNNNEISIFSKAITREIYYSLITAFGNKSLVELGDNYIKLNFISEEQLPAALYEAHIKNNLKNKLAKASEYLSLEQI